MDMIKTKKKILTHHHNLSRVFTYVEVNRKCQIIFSPLVFPVYLSIDTQGANCYDQNLDSKIII